MNKVLAIVILAFGLIAISLLTTSLIISNRLDTRTYVNHYTSLSTPKEGKFTAAHNNLSSVIFSLKNPEFSDKGAFSALISSTDGGIVRSFEFSGYNIEDPSDIRFIFDPIIDSAAKEYTLKLERKSEGDTLVQVGVDEEGGVVATSYYKVENRPRLFIELVNNLFRRILVDKVFIVVWATMLGGLIWIAQKQD